MEEAVISHDAQETGSAASEQENEEANAINCNKEQKREFKMPALLIGPRKGAHKFTKIKQNNAEVIVPEPSEIKEHSPLPIANQKESNPPLKYNEPPWSLRPKRAYSLEVLKNGTIDSTHELTGAYFVFGRAVASNCVLLHPTISRYHAVLQYGQPEGEPSPGFFIYDLNSTHGTFLNKMKIKPCIFVRMQVNHMLKLGGSSRLFILQGPPDDVEPESELTVTELKNLRLKKKLLEDLEKQKEEDVGIDWGLGEDAEEETDLSINPFAAAPNEELYIDDPKKTLRGWFEREGCELVYNCEEKGFGQFVCRVDLPVENARGGSVVAEAIVRGKKKEAVVQCALEACRILDQHGLLRQATHESKRKKSKDWEADDFYDSDEDPFLDRTGTIERKRKKRMQEAGVSQVVHTYPELMAEHKKLLEEVERVEKALSGAAPQKKTTEVGEDDELDKFMAGLENEELNKGKITLLKSELSQLKQDEARVRKLANIARPAGTPELLPPWPSENATSSMKPSQSLMIGKRRNLIKKPSSRPVQPAKVEQKPDIEDDEEFDSD